MEEKSFIKGTRPHLTKEQRIPKFIKDAEKVIKSVKSCKSNFKTVLANSRFRGNHFKKVYSLTLNVLKHYDYIQCIIKELNLLEKENNLRRELATILIYEVIFGKGQLPGESKPVITIQGYINDIMYAHQKLQYSDSFILKGFDLPRYARIHTLVTTVPYVVKDLENIGFQQISYDENIAEEKYIELVKSLQRRSFMVDFHFKDMLVFSHDENLLNLELYQKGHIFLQDKSSYIPVHALNPEPGSAVLDACAAPGMKCVHMAAKMKNKGILLACERDKDRFETLKEMIQYGGVKISKLFCKDFKLMDPDDQAYCSLDYILLDPSCSGSGMVNRMDEVTDTDDSKNQDRLQKLAGFQIILLKHALKFPSVKRVVYSTCSINEEENEYVVHEALSAFNNSFKLVPVMPEWTTRGLKQYEHGELCLRTVPEEHLTNGFFVAMFERLDGSENYIKNYRKHKGQKMKIEEEKFNVESIEENVDVDPHPSSKRRKKYLQDSQLSAKVKDGNETFEQGFDTSSSRKSRKYHLCNSESSNANEEAYEGIAGSSKKRKHTSSSYVPTNNEETIPKYSSKHKKKQKIEEIRYEPENQSDCTNLETYIDTDLSQKCEKKKKHKAKDIKMEKILKKEESQQLASSLKKSDFNEPVEFQHSDDIGYIGSVKHKKKKKHKNESEKTEIEVTKHSEKVEFITTETKKRKHNKYEMLNCDGDNFMKKIAKPHEFGSISFDKSADNIENDTCKNIKKHHKKCYQYYIKDSCDNTLTLTNEKMPKIEESNESLLWKKRNKHKKHSKECASTVDTSIKFNVTPKTKNMDVGEKNEEKLSYLLPESVNDLEYEPTKRKKNKKHKKHSRDV